MLLGLHALAFVVVSATGLAALGAYSGNHIARETTTITVLEWTGVWLSVVTLIVVFACFLLWRHRWAQVVSRSMLLSWPVQVVLIMITHSLKY